MRIEVITPNADPDRGGFGMRVHGLVSTFAEFADVRVVFTDPSSGVRVPRVEYVSIPIRDRFATRLQRLRTFYRTDFPPRNGTSPPDLVVVESLDLFGLNQYGLQVPIVLDEHNIYWNLLRYEMKNAPFFRGWVGRRRMVRRFFIPRLLERAKRFEVAAIRSAARTVVTSDEDRRAVLAECPEAEPTVRVVPNCVDVRRIPALPAPADSGTVVFVGDFNYGPNREAAEFVTRTLAPRLPEVQFRLVGSNLPPGPLAANVVATGYVRDLWDALRDAAVCIGPLAHGSGTRMKILTYLAAGKAVVATTKACEGLPLEDGRHAILRDDPMAFEEAVRGLLEDPERRRRMGSAGRDLVESAFDWRVHAAALRTIADEACAQHAG